MLTICKIGQGIAKAYKKAMTDCYFCHNLATMSCGKRV